MSKNTVYIIGAGASCEANLPSGHDLKKQIVGYFKPTTVRQQPNAIYEALAHHSALNPVHNQSIYLRYTSECAHLAASLPLAISIDNFLDAHRENQELIVCGKLSIVRAILNAEKNSRLFSEGDMTDFASLEDTWYISLFRSITENCSLADLENRFKKITFIVFNYDRCIEYFIFNALKTYYKASEKIAAELVNSIKIIHPYGQVGHLKWQNKDNSLIVDFGGDVIPLHLIKFSEKIRTFTEGTDSEEKQDIITAMEHAERLIFLGFAFHKLNMQLLSNDQGGKYKKDDSILSYATALGSSKSDINHFETMISNLYDCPSATFIENTTCNNIFLVYSRSFRYD